MELDEPNNTRLHEWVDSVLRADFDEEGGARASWQSDEVAVCIWWDAAGTVETCDVFPLRRAPESPLAVVRRWLGL
jgi:hypothetical protein